MNSGVTNESVAQLIKRRDPFIKIRQQIYPSYFTDTNEVVRIANNGSLY